MIALYIAMDSFGTACNVTGDGFIALLINKWFPSAKQTLPDPLSPEAESIKTTERTFPESLPE